MKNLLFPLSSSALKQNLATTVLCTIFSLGLLQGLSQEPKKAESVDINGTTHYYEVYGSGEPLVLLHGWGQSSKYWHSYINDYKDDFTVYIVDLQGFGRSDKLLSDWSIYSVAQNLNSLLVYLKLDQIKGIGLSYGGDILLQLSVINPHLVKSMVIIGSGLGDWNAREYPDYMEYFSLQNVENLTEMKSYHSSEEQFHAALRYFGNYNIQISDEEFHRIESNVLIIYGDDNGYSINEIMRARTKLTNSDLWIIPDSGHVANDGKNRNHFVEISKAFITD